MAYFEFLAQFVSRVTRMRRGLGPAADHHLLVDTRATRHLLSAPVPTKKLSWPTVGEVSRTAS